METELVYLDDAYLKSIEATVIDRRDDAVALDRTVLYPTGGGQPHDTGALRIDGTSIPIDTVKKDGLVIWHHLDLGQATAADIGSPDVGSVVEVEIDWERRHQLMRTHSAMHVLCGVIWNEYNKAVTGGNMEPLKGRMDFEFDPLPDGFAERVAAAVNAEIEADRRIEVSYLDRSAALADEDLIRTKVNLIPEAVTRIRVVDIIGLDKQADGGTHVASTGEIGHFEITKTESKGKGNKRVRIQLR
ncbi:MAG: alanyl-tRNA editing protein [Actinomycetia bacterium]|nr:alanyl-tRNA editing protein [Actinomycetes bacterium]